MLLFAQILALMVLKLFKKHVYYVQLKNVKIAMVQLTDVQFVLYLMYCMKENVFHCVPINISTEHKMESLVQNAQLVVSHALMKNVSPVLMAIL